MELPLGAFPFSLILREMRNLLVKKMNIEYNRIKIVVSDNYKAPRIDPVFVALRPFAPVPVDPHTGGVFPDSNVGRYGRAIGRIVRVYLHTRSGIDRYGSDHFALIGKDAEKTSIDSNITPRHLLYEEILLNILDNALLKHPNEDVSLLLGPIHWISSDVQSYPARKPINEDGVVESFLDFQLVYLSAISFQEPAT